MPEDTRPEYVPPAVWQFWTENRSKPFFDSRAMQEAARRLFGLAADCDRDRNGRPEIARTWRALHQRVTEPQDWRLLFDLFWTLPDTLDREARNALKRARREAAIIAKLADELAERLHGYSELAARHGIEQPAAGRELSALLADAARAVGDDERDGRLADPALISRDGPSLTRIQYLPHRLDPAAVAYAIYAAFDGFKPACYARHAPHASTTQTAPMNAWVWHFDARLATLQKSLQCAPLAIGATDTARLLTAALASKGLQYTAETVAYARNPPQRIRTKKRD